MTNNPGSAGGALTDRRGRLAGMLGKELRNVQDNTWLNYALPVGELSAAVADLIAGKARPRDPSDTSRKPREPATLASLGIVLVPDVLSKTPPFVDRVISGSAADKAGVRPDDLVLLVNDHTVTSVKAMVDELSFIDRIDEVRLVLQRDQELLQVSLFATGR
jgi:serine protease Do